MSRQMLCNGRVHAHCAGTAGLLLAFTYVVGGWNNLAVWPIVKWAAESFGTGVPRLGNAVLGVGGTVLLCG